jgi:hypothetical protein
MTFSCVPSEAVADLPQDADLVLPSREARVAERPTHDILL